MIELKNVSFSYREKKIIDDISLTFGFGESCALIGRNGCGKTTLAKLISRLDRPQSGELLLDGRAYSEYSGREFAQKLAFFPQSRPLPQMSVYDYVCYGRYPYSPLSFRLGESDRAAVERALKLTGSEKFAGRRISELSGGERQLCYLSMLIAQDTPYILLDEPTAFIDAANGFLVMDIIKTLKSEGKCVIVILHDIAQALACFDRIAVMHRGRVIGDGTPEEILPSGAIEKAFGVFCERLGENDYILRKI